MSLQILSNSQRNSIVSGSAKPFERKRFSTHGPFGTAFTARGFWALAGLLFFATLTISLHDPLYAWTFEIAAFTLAVSEAVKRWRAGGPAVHMAVTTGALLWGLAAFGPLQLALGWYEYRYAAVDGGLRLAALSATAYAAASILALPGRIQQFARLAAWFGAAVCAVSVLAYFTSPDRMLWIFPSRYPDVWGPFYSRNDFAVFAELMFPLSWWRATPAARDPAHKSRTRMPVMAAVFMPVLIPAMILASGIASASRAGAFLLAGELALCLAASWRSHRSTCQKFLVLVAPLGALLSGTLWLRLSDHDPFHIRREILASTWNMVLDRPLFEHLPFERLWKGYGLGSFRQVYPAYANVDFGAMVEHAHNDWLEWMVEGGIPLALVWAMLAGAALRKILHAPWALGVAAVFLHALVDYPFAHFGITAWIFVLIGALEAVRFEKNNASRALELSGRV